jgi:hypothetical protein
MMGSDKGTLVQLVQLPCQGPASFLVSGMVAANRVSLDDFAVSIHSIYRKMPK